VNLDELSDEMRHYRHSINKALSEMVNHGRAYAEAERDYRKSKAISWLQVPDDVTQAAHKATWVDAQTADLRYARDIAQKLYESAKAAVGAREKQMNSIQSEMAAWKSEASLARFSTDET
jgi:hypothetical protein